MLKHEVKLIDPGPDAVTAALTAATTAANKRCRTRLLGDDPAKWRKFAREAAASPDGYAMFRGGRGGVPATQVLAAWWTDAIGRKHVVIRGRRVEHDDAKRLLQKDDLARRSPLWHAYPDYVCRRTMNGTEQIVCACGCGAVGTPDSLSWMGETCGPCFDRKEEMGAAGLRANLPGVLYGDRGPLSFVSCAPDGTRAAAVEGDNCVSYWDIPDRTRTTIKFSDQRVFDVAVTSDARHLIATGINQTGLGGLFAVFDLTTDPPTRLDLEGEEVPPGWRVVALPRADAVLLHRFNLATGRSRAETVRVPSGEVTGAVELPAGFPGRLVLAPDGRRFATCTPVAVYDSTSPGRGVALGDGANVVAFSHDGARVFVHGGSGLVARDTGNGSIVAVGDRKAGYLTCLATDPGGEFVYAGTYQGLLLVLEAETLRPRAAFAWHLGSINDLAISADGSRLFSAGGDGCIKVWPIRELLRG